MIPEGVAFEGLDTSEEGNLRARMRRLDGERVLVDAATLRRRIRRLAPFGEPVTECEAALAELEAEERRRAAQRPTRSNERGR